MFKEVNKTIYYEVCDDQRTIHCCESFKTAEVVADVLKKDYCYNARNISICKVVKTMYKEETGT